MTEPITGMKKAIQDAMIAIGREPFHWDELVQFENHLACYINNAMTPSLLRATPEQKPLFWSIYNALCLQESDKQLT